MVEISQATIGKNHPEYAIALHNLARVRYETGDLEKAVDLQVEAVEISTTELGPSHSTTTVLQQQLDGLRPR